MKVYEALGFCSECRTASRCVMFSCVPLNVVLLCAECIRVAGIILARAEKDAARDDVPAPEGERR